MCAAAVVRRLCTRLPSWVRREACSGSTWRSGCWLRSLWQFVLPGGKLAITTWGPRFLEPATSAFWTSIRHERPDLFKAFNPWDRICDPLSLRALFTSAGIEDVDVQPQSNWHEIGTPDAWWAAVLGSGYRGTIVQLDADALQRVKSANLDFIRSSRVRKVEANVVYAVAEKAGA